ncbi:MAG TPA: hypothetical protein VLX44_08540 [Xanthobacteraceae bacterium]|nr:hypothetical protein [Xanthobacteraceae bacterium]
MTALIDEGNAHPWLAELVFALDGILRQRHQVFEFTADPACIFRAQLDRAERRFDLADGTRIRPGDRLLNLHYWNEQVPRVPLSGPTIGWARRFCRRMELSLRQLARFCTADPAAYDVVAVAANVAQGTRRQRDQLTGIMHRFGFTPPLALEPAPSNAMLRRFGENLLIAGIVLARNPGVLRFNTLWRDRTELFLSRTALVERFGEPVRRDQAAPHVEDQWRTR